MAHDVFISYSAQDKAVAYAVCATLESKKIRCWIAPRDVLPGITYAEALIDGLSGSRILVLVFSTSSNNSPQVMREVERAVTKGITVIPLRIEDATPSKAMEYFLSTTQWLDALTSPHEKHFQRLADIIQQLLAQEAVIRAKKEAEAVRERAREAEKSAGAVVEEEKPAHLQMPEPTARQKAKMPVRRSLIAIVGVVLFLIAGVSGVYFAFGHPFTPSPPPAIQDVSVSDITEASAVITWTTDKPTTSQVEYGYTTEYGLATALDEGLATSHRVELTELQQNETCYFRVVSKDADGHEATSDTQQLTTLQPDTIPPVISNVKVAKYTGETATITWETDEDAIGQVEYGTTDAYDRLGASDAEFRTNHSVELTGLQPKTTYHFRIKARDGEGNEAWSGDYTFTTWLAERDWNEYINEEYGFSVNYPKKWKENKDEEKDPSVFYAADPARAPAMRVAVVETATFADAVTTGLGKAGASDIKVGAEKETTLADGTTKGTTAKVDLRSKGYAAESYALGVKKGDKWVTVVVSTVALVTPYDEAKFSQIAHTLRFTAEE